MRTTPFFLFRLSLVFPLFFICSHLHSTPFPRKEKIAPFFYFKLYGQAQYFSYEKQDGILDIKFPYSIISESGSAAHTFSSSKTNLTGVGKYSHTFPGFEIGYGRFSLDANMNFMTGPVWGWTDNFYFGLNYRLASPHSFFPDALLNFGSFSFRAPTYNEYSPWRVTLRMGIQYYHPLYELGEIATETGHFSASGQTLPPMDS
ncbi:MAG: hypothetical protein M3R17_03800, partial [Bacteroidota bacterium]|nr:hypothetical protein [Bacteroidota bacterium]